MEAEQPPSHWIDVILESETASLHTLDFLDNHTGPTESGESEEAINTSQFTATEGRQSAFVPAGGTYRLEVRAQSAGSGRLVVIESAGVEPVRRLIYDGLTWTENGKGTLQFTDLVSSPVLQLDEDGDGTIDREVSPAIPPVANAGADQKVSEGEVVMLDGSQSLDPQGQAVAWAWRQTGGPPVALSDGSAVQPSFTAPEVDADTVLSFELTVTAGGRSSEPGHVAVTVKNVADLSLAQSVSPAAAVLGSTVTYTFRVQNAGNRTAHSVKLKDELPAGLRFVTASTSRGTWAFADGILTCDLGTLLAGEAVEVTLKVEPGVTGRVLNAPLLLLAEEDPNRANEAAAAPLTVLEKFANVRGVYAGLIQPLTPTHARSGRLGVTVGLKGAFTAAVVLGGRSYSLRGTFDQFGVASAAIGNTSLRIEFQLDMTNHSDQLTAKITENGNVVANVQADRPPSGFTAKKPSPQAGRYTLLLPPDPAHPEAAYPQGTGYATLTVGASGYATMAGLLGDQTWVGQGAAFSKDGRYPVYVALSAMKGSLSGWLTIDKAATNAVAGTLHWFKPATRTPSWYPAEFSGEIAVQGSTYHAPPTQAQILPAGPATVTINGGNVTVNPAVKNVTIDVQNRVKITGNDRFTMTLRPSTGLFQGAFYDTAKNLRTFRGAVLQKQNRGAGLFKGSGQTGNVELSR